MVAVASNINNFNASKITKYDSVVQIIGDYATGSGGLLKGTNYVLGNRPQEPKA
jgi:hypothetical protein